MKIMPIFGTRPEAIKLAPVIRALQGCSWVEVVVCVTAQHREMLDMVLEVFDIKPNYDLDIMTADQDLYDVTCGVLMGLRDLLRKETPDLVLVQGDTTTVLSASLAAYYEGIAVGHVEAGLRTSDKRNPFPEEINRRVASVLADIHFAPTAHARESLLSEGLDERQIYVTGNTVVDSLFWALDLMQHTEIPKVQKIQDWVGQVMGGRRYVLITAHRRESFGDPFRQMCLAIRSLADSFPDVHWVYPVHFNPNVKKPVYDILGNSKTIHLIEPMSYFPFIWLMSKSYIILTDSGGIQEESTSLGKPVLVMRETTERPEGIEAGTSILVGRNKNKIIETATHLLNDSSAYEAIANKSNPYGDGHSSERISQIIHTHFKLN